MVAVCSLVEEVAVVVAEAPVLVVVVLSSVPLLVCL